jgi:hypothetical protein
MEDKLFTKLLTYGYGRREAKHLSLEIKGNLDKYLTIYEARLELIRRVQNVRK